MLTVLLATRNRAPLLRDVLESYCHLQSPPSGWKLVVVDNHSTDQTAHIVASFSDRLPVQYVFEGKLGKNCALNTGLEWVEGDLTVLTDDDAFPHSDWLLQLRRAADTQAEFSMFGGAVVPRWEVPPPRWIPWVEAGPAYTLTSPSLKEGPILPCFVFGPNMAIRNSIIQSGVRFDPGIGPRGSSYPMGSETELVLRLGRKGHQAWHVADAVVEHFIREKQLNKAWVLQRAIRYGRGQYRLSPAEEVNHRKLWMGIPRHLFRDIPKEAVLMAAEWISLRQEALFRRHWRFNFLRGQAIEARILAWEQATPSSSTYAVAQTKEAARRDW
jgi:glycosyltransferase involved in cell wall biosynthesis